MINLDDIFEMKLEIRVREESGEDNMLMTDKQKIKKLEEMSKNLE
jgi:hypothetical protein